MNTSLLIAGEASQNNSTVLIVCLLQRRSDNNSRRVDTVVDSRHDTIAWTWSLICQHDVYASPRMSRLSRLAVTEYMAALCPRCHCTNVHCTAPHFLTYLLTYFNGSHRCVLVSIVREEMASRGYEWAVPRYVTWT